MTQPKRTHHMGITRELLIQVVRERGAKWIDRKYTGTDEAAIRDLESGPEIVCTCACIKNANGSCSGRTEPAP